MFRYAAVAILLSTQASFADIAVRFVESAPKDRFIIENTGDCALTASGLTLDMTGSAGGLIFDVTGSGAGVEVFQPFDLVAGAASLDGVPQVRDGDRAISLSIRALAPGDQIAFTIDVDDTAEARGIMVSGAEITGAAVRITGESGTRSAEFDAGAAATVVAEPCAST
ncbi:aggregation factor core [uncultured Roseobacter sp.]|uniref:aggregation factor core n=1 Tax=uncultured Roseobacter sp. TaxID=114847 RepID=UPI0026333601|nr:aggregation factor core [uncultured Roseobacter sp.]